MKPSLAITSRSAVRWERQGKGLVELGHQEQPLAQAINDVLNFQIVSTYTVILLILCISFL